MQQYFHELADFLNTCLRGPEQYKCWFGAEDSDFVRLNRSAVRQPGHVRQAVLTVDLMNGHRHAASTLTLGGTIDYDRFALERAISQVRARLAHLPEDPHLLVSTSVSASEHVQSSRLPAASAIVDEVLDATRGLDLVGFLASGPIYRGFANSFGQRNWHETASFNLDWSLYHSRDKAVKTSYAGFDWDTAVFRNKFNAATEQLACLKREPVTVKPGAYRAYLTPTAMFELVAMLNWDGVSEKALRTKQSSLRRMRFEGAHLHPSFTLCENTAEGLAPGFQSDGFIKPECVTLIEQGELAGSMVSPRSAREYGIDTNGADAGEVMQSIDVAAGSLPMADVLRELGTGIWISNLWYTNFSDRASCRVTGMTRFACFWVENGEIRAPLNVMRFDDSLLRVFGDNLEALTQEREMIVDDSTYGSRQTGSGRLPGALLKELAFVL